MKVLLLGMLALSLAFEEPEPINEEEKYDEVAEAQKRAVWIACLSAIKTRLDTSQDAVQGIASAKSVDYSKAHKKVVTSMLSKCVNTVSPSKAEEILMSDVVDLKIPELQSCCSIDSSEFKSLELTSEETQLLQAIQEEINKKDEVFEQEPPVVENFQSSKNEILPMPVQYLGLGVGLLFLTGLVYLGFKVSQPKKPKKKTK